MIFRFGPDWHWLAHRHNWNDGDLLVMMSDDVIVIPPHKTRAERRYDAYGFFINEKYELISVKNFEGLLRNKIIKLVQS